MKRPVFVFTALLALSGILPTSPSLGNSYICREVKLKPLRSVRGVVVDPMNAPIPGAVVQILRGADKVAAVTTGDDGRFSFEGLDPGEYDIRADAPGFNTSLAYHIRIVKPKPKSKRMLRIGLAPWTTCSRIEIVKDK